MLLADGGRWEALTAADTTATIVGLRAGYLGRLRRPPAEGGAVVLTGVVIVALLMALMIGIGVRSFIDLSRQELARRNRAERGRGHP